MYYLTRGKNALTHIHTQPQELQVELRPCTLRKCAGPKPVQTEEQGTGTLCPREQTSESVCDAVLSECESTHPLNPRMQPVPCGEFAPGPVPAISS